MTSMFRATQGRGGVIMPTEMGRDHARRLIEVGRIG